jgi:hypothetical protein
MKITFASLLLCSVLIFSCKNNASENKTGADPNTCTQYACPMHPDKTSSTPAKCPECGMDMQPVTKKTGADSAEKK